MRPIVLTIMDGWGYSSQQVGNAILTAQTPTIREIEQKYPSMLLQASGTAVGMGHSETGNSEVGHLTLGAGRVIFQYFSRINKAIENGDFYANPVLQEAASHVQKNSSTFHIAGLLTSGAVHASFAHLTALVKFAKDAGLPYRLHLFLDGRDSGLKEGVDLLKRLSEEIGDLSDLASIVGRDLAMDRNNNWQRTETTFNLLVHPEGGTSDIFSTLDGYYKQNLSDAEIPATVVNLSPIKENDALVFFNFREDSMRQLARAFTQDGFDGFQTTVPTNLYVAAMCQYTPDSKLHAMFPAPPLPNCLSEVLSTNTKKHLHIAETEKYAHVTFFFNGLRDKPFDGETDFFIDSLEHPTEHPEMKVQEIAEKVCAELDREAYDVYVINFANADILAHLGNLEATIKGVEAIDKALALLKQKVLEKNGVMIITADHGNAESMIYKGTGDKETRHDANPVPLYLISSEYERERTPEEVIRSRANTDGLLADVAPTILEIMGIEKPVEMTGQSLLHLLS